MQWTAGPQGGFTAGTPWLPVNPDFPAVNAAAEEADTDSVLCFVRLGGRSWRIHDVICAEEAGRKRCAVSPRSASSPRWTLGAGPRPT